MHKIIVTDLCVTFSLADKAKNQKKGRGKRQGGRGRGGEREDKEGIEQLLPL